MRLNDKPTVALCPLAGAANQNHMWQRVLGHGIQRQATNPGEPNPLRRVYTSKRNLFRQHRSLQWMTRVSVTRQESSVICRFQSCCCNYFVDVCACLSAELWQLNRSWVFQGHGASLQPQTMLLDEGHQRLYVGAKNTLFSLSLDRVNSDPREVGQTVCEEVRHIELAHSGGNGLAKQSSFMLYMSVLVPDISFPADMMVVWSIFQ